MKLRASPERAITFTRLSVALMCAWPPSTSATKNQVLLFKIFWCFCFVSSICLVVPLMHAVLEYRSDPVILGKTVCLLCAAIQITMKMLMCHAQHKRFQALIFEMEHFCKHANINERIVLQRYVDRYKYIHVIYTLWVYFTSAFVISGPLYLPQSLPAHAKYIFSVESQPLKSIVYLHQSFVGFQASSGMTIDCQIALFTWYTAARFELLKMKLRDVTSEPELDDIIKEHTKLIRYTREINRAVKLLIVTTIMTTAVGLLFGSLNFVTDQPLVLKTLFVAVVVTASVELFMCALPADSLMHMSTDCSLGVYSSNWYERNVGMQKKILLLVLRLQKAESITVSSILPTLSLSFYASYLYTSLSYFTALRIMIGGNQN